jgi:MFS family permease
MWHEPEAAPDLVIVCAATLDEPGWVVPTSHIFVAEAAPDSVAAADAATFAGAAIPGRQALWDRFADIYGRRPAAP